MFTIQQIETAHNNVKSGADFPRYMQDIIQLGVTGFETFVSDSHTVYSGTGGYKTSSAPQYDALIIADHCNCALFARYLKEHQHGQSDYFTFCKQCAETGVEKWTVNMAAMTCVYYDTAGNEVLTEMIPVP